MTIKELYKWALENKVENFELKTVSEDKSCSFTKANLITYKDKSIIEID